MKFLINVLVPGHTLYGYSTPNTKLGLDDLVFARQEQGVNFNAELLESIIPSEDLNPCIELSEKQAFLSGLFRDSSEIDLDVDVDIFRHYILKQSLAKRDCQDDKILSVKLIYIFNSPQFLIDLFVNKFEYRSNGIIYNEGISFINE